MNTITRISSIAVALTVALALAACKVGPDYKEPDMQPPAQFSEIDSATQPTTQSTTRATTQPISADQPPQDYQQWWTTFNDAKLNSLIERAVRTNPDIAAAVARILEARAVRGVATSGLFPQVDANGSYTYTRYSNNLPGLAALAGGLGSAGGVPGAPSLTTGVWEAGFDATWEIDVFGGTRRSIEAANYNLQAAVQDLRDVRVSLLAEVAVNYIQLRGAQRELDIAQHNLQSQEQTLALTRSRAEGGLIPYLNVAQQEAQVATTAAQVPTFQTQIRQNIHHLGILLGQDPGALSGELSGDAPIPVGPTSVPPGIPSELLRRRPDVRRAERQLAAATAQIGVATADLFPQFSVTGALGLESGAFKQLFDYSSRFYDIAPGVTWDIFDAGKVSYNIKVQDARQAEALAAYRKAVLQSMQDVDDALVAYNREQVRLQSLRDAVSANQRAVDLSTELFEKGSTDFLSVLDAERDLFTAQDAMARSEQQVSANLVALYKALGGGWEAEK
jgi:NodT family efflux transporter outer membrane factor (OMF) lipoprotein